MDTGNSGALCVLQENNGFGPESLCVMLGLVLHWQASMRRQTELLSFFLACGNAASTLVLYRPPTSAILLVECLFGPNAENTCLSHASQNTFMPIGGNPEVSQPGSLRLSLGHGSYRNVLIRVSDGGGNGKWGKHTG